jgi:hypothetical protein
VRESLGDLGLLVGGAAVDAGTTRVVHRHVGVDRLVAHPASPTVTPRDVIEETHPSKLACQPPANDSPGRGERRQSEKGARDSLSSAVRLDSRCDIAPPMAAVTPVGSFSQRTYLSFRPEGVGIDQGRDAP